MVEYFFEELRKNTTLSVSEMLKDFTKGEIGVLSYLSFDKNEVTAGELSEKLHVSTARIASILNGLENKGYINRKEDVFDKRKIIINITGCGKDLAIKTKEDIINKLSYIINELGEKDAKEYLRITLRIKNILSKR